MFAYSPDEEGEGDGLSEKGWCRSLRSGRWRSGEADVPLRESAYWNAKGKRLWEREGKSAYGNAKGKRLREREGKAPTGTRRESAYWNAKGKRLLERERESAYWNATG
jgi:hypothetical protein